MFGLRFDFLRHHELRLAVPRLEKDAVEGQRVRLNRPGEGLGFELDLCGIPCVRNQEAKVGPLLSAATFIMRAGYWNAL
jgi:hypothetical protein